MKFNTKCTLKNFSFFLLILVILLSCNNNKNKNDTESISVVWPNVKFDTVYAPDFLIDSSNSFDSDSLFVMYNDSLRVKHKKIKIFTRNYYIVEGDLLLNEYKYNQYRILALQQKRVNKILNKIEVRENDQTEKAALRVDVINGRPIRWPEGDTITYCINRHSFKTQGNFEQVKLNMQTASKEWMNTCNVVFKYKPEFDKQNFLFGNDKIDFVVLEYDAAGDFIAKSFFPLDPVEDKNLIIDLSYYTTSFDHVGVLRHELGHILGWRHEHISSEAPAACPDEIITGTIPLTIYDPQSVMHYYCGGVGSKELKITIKDKLGAQQVYGIPR